MSSRNANNRSFRANCCCTAAKALCSLTQFFAFWWWDLASVWTLLSPSFIFHLIEKAKCLPAVSSKLAHVESHLSDAAFKCVGQHTALLIPLT